MRSTKPDGDFRALQTRRKNGYQLVILWSPANMFHVTAHEKVTSKLPTGKLGAGSLAFTVFATASAPYSKRFAA